MMGDTRNINRTKDVLVLLLSLSISGNIQAVISEALLRSLHQKP